MPTGTYTKSNSPTATYGTNSAANLALQNAINTVSTNKIATDSMYGDQTKNAYDSLISQGYTYLNGAFTKANSGNSSNNNQNGNTTPDSPGVWRPIYEDPSSQTPVKTEEEFQKEKMRMAQGQIDSLNAYYNSLVEESKVLGKKNVRSTNAISALTGLGGSSEADVAMNKTDTENAKDIKRIENERNMAVQAILGNVRESSVAAAKQAREEARQSEQDRISYREKASADAVSHLTALSKATGATLEGIKATVTPEEYDYLIKNAGGETMARAILFENRPKDTLLGNPTVVGGHVVQYYKKPDGSISAENVLLPDGVAPDNIHSITKSGDGSTVIIKKDGTWSKISGTAKTGGSSGSYKSGKAVFSSEQLSQFSGQLESSKGSDGYVDPDVYQSAYSAWVDPKVGGLAKDFLAKYPPKKYVNPANNTLPAYLRSTAPTKAKTSRRSA